VAHTHAPRRSRARLLTLPRREQVPVGKTPINIRFFHPEADGSFAIFIEQTWLTSRAINNKTAEGFTITFVEAAPKDAKLDWMLVH
jgi:hypothetical protein